MPLSGTRLGDAIADAAIATMPQAPSSGDEAAFRSNMVTIFGDEIVSEIVANALVSIPFVMGVSSGVQNSGPGSGTVT